MVNVLLKLFLLLNIYFYTLHLLFIYKLLYIMVYIMVYMHTHTHICYNGKNIKKTILQSIKPFKFFV